jgi:hypothetical protein
MLINTAWAEFSGKLWGEVFLASVKEDFLETLTQVKLTPSLHVIGWERGLSVVG